MSNIYICNEVEDAARLVACLNTMMRNELPDHTILAVLDMIERRLNHIRLVFSTGESK